MYCTLPLEIPSIAYFEANHISMVSNPSKRASDTQSAGPNVDFFQLLGDKS
jgi:hypothetical protein